MALRRICPVGATGALVLLLLTPFSASDLAAEAAVPARRSELPRVRLSVLPLDLTRPPSDAELMAAGQLGGALYPSHETTDAARRDEVNLSFGRAIQAWNDHQYDKASRLFKDHLERFPDSHWASEVVLHLGCDARYRGRYRMAERHFRWIMDRHREDSDVYGRMLRNKARQRLAVLQVLQNDFDGAREEFRLLEQDSPSWRHRTYASHWIQRLSRYRAAGLALYNCGTLALAHVLQREGHELEAREVRELEPVTRRGHSIDELAALAGLYGYELVGLRLAPEDLYEIPLPAILQLAGNAGGGTGHYWVLERADGDGLALYDPQSRVRFDQRDGEFATEWDGVALVFATGRDTLPGERLTPDEMAAIHGGCCGHPQPTDNTGDPGQAAGPGHGGDSCGAPMWRVNMVSLNFYLRDTPLWYRPPIGPPVEIALSYNSQSAFAFHEPFGNKWRHNYGTYLTVNTVGTVLIHMPDGRVDEYPADGSGGFLPMPRVHHELVRTAPERYELRLRGGGVYVYGTPTAASTIGSGESSKSGANSPDEIIAQYFLVELRDAYGQALLFDYDSSGRLVWITDALGRQTTLTYNADDLVEQVADPFGRTALFEYDPDQNLTRITDMGGYWSALTYDSDIYITSIENSRGVWTFKTEPADGIIANADDYPPPDDDMWENSRLTVTSPLGEKEEYFYYGGCDMDLGICTGYTWYVSPRDYIEWRSRDLNNYKARAPKIRYFPVYFSGSQAAIGKITTPEGRDQRFEYDEEGNLTALYDADHPGVSLTYNDRGMITSVTDAEVQVTDFIYAENDVDLLEIRSALGDVVMTYNDSYDITSITDRLQNTSQISYNGFGQITTVTDPIATTTYEYDAGHQLVQATRDGKPLFVRTYDSLGHIATATDGAGLTLGFGYNDLNLVTQISYSDGRTVDLAYDSCCPGLAESVTDRAGRTTSYKHDAVQRLIEVKSPEAGVTRYSYDADGNLVLQIDPAGHATAFTYDHDDRLVRKTFADGSFESYAYDELARLASVTNVRGTAIEYAYDDRNRLAEINYSDATPDITLGYDDNGRLTSRTDGLGLTQFTYDAENRLRTKDGPWAGDTITFDYDALGRVESIVVEGGQARLYDYDPIGRLQTVEVGSDTFTYVYTGGSPLPETLIRPSGSETGYQRDSLSRPTQVRNQDALSQIVSQYTYTHHIEDLFATEVAVDGFSDPSLAGEVVVYEYDETNRLLSYADPPQSVAHDADGNLTQGFTPDGHSYTAEFDAENRLVAVEYSDGVVVRRTEYHYDGSHSLGRILHREDGAVVSDRRLVVFGFLPAQERDAANQVQSEYTWDPTSRGGVGGLLGARLNGADYEYLYDGNGNVTGVLDDSAAVVAEYAYDPFGLPRARTGSLDQDFRFSTKRYDERTGLAYFGRRFYSPLLGRWTARDPIAERDGTNLYAAMHNDPINRVDPYGLWSLSWGAFYFVGGEITIYSNPDGSMDWSVGLGLGFSGASLGFNPEGTSPQYGSCDGAYGGLGGFAQAGFNIPFIAQSLGTESGVTASPDTAAALYSNSGSAWSFTSSTMVGVGGAAGVRITNPIVYKP